MRIVLLALVAIAWSTVAAADPFTAGLVRITVEDERSFDSTVWYPTRAAESAVQFGPYTLSIARDAEIAPGGRYPVILLSHGRRGTPLGHRELAAHLARSGFIVVAPAHAGDTAGQPFEDSQRRILIARPRQSRLALDRVLADPRFAPHADAGRVGTVGFSAGGYTALALAGARPDLRRATAYCREHPDDLGSCGPAGTGGVGDAVWPALNDPRIRAIVVMDPLAILFGRDELAAVHLPVLLMRPENDFYLSAKGNALGLAAALPTPPQQAVVPGGHFVFVEPCPDIVAQALPNICRDAAGVDRAAIHRQLQQQITAFLRQTL